MNKKLYQYIDTCLPAKILFAVIIAIQLIAISIIVLNTPVSNNVQSNTLEVCNATSSVPNVELNSNQVLKPHPYNYKFTCVGISFCILAFSIIWHCEDSARHAALRQEHVRLMKLNEKRKQTI